MHDRLIADNVQMPEMGFEQAKAMMADVMAKHRGVD